MTSEQQSLFPTPEDSGNESAPEPYKGDAYEGDLHPVYHDPVEVPTPQEKAIGKAGIATARAILKQVKERQ